MTTADRLAEAEAAYHALMTGQAVVEVTDQSGERVRFTTANASRLSIYIAQLKTEIAGTIQSRGPMRPMFKF